MSEKKYGHRGPALPETTTIIGARSFTADRQRRLQAAANAEVLAKARAAVEQEAQLRQQQAERLRAVIKQVMAERDELRQRNLVLSEDNDELKRCIAEGAVPGWKINRQGRLHKVGAKEHEVAG